MRNILNKYIDCHVVIRTAQSNFEGTLRQEDFENEFYLEQSICKSNFEYELGKTYFNLEKIESISVTDNEYERVCNLKEKEEQEIKLENERNLKYFLNKSELSYFVNKIKRIEFYLYNDFYKIYYFEEFDATQSVEEIRVDRNEELIWDVSLLTDDENERLPDFIRLKIKEIVKEHQSENEFNPFEEEE